MEWDFCNKTGCKLDMKANLASFFDDLVILPLFGRPSDQAVLRSSARLVVPAFTEAITRVSVPSYFKPRCGIVEPHAAVVRQPYVVAKALVTVRQMQPCNQRYTYCRVLNLSMMPCVIRRSDPLATIAEAISVRVVTQSIAPNVKERPSVSMEEKNKQISELGLQISRQYMDDSTYERLCSLLFLLLNCLTLLGQISYTVTLKQKVILFACDLIVCHHRCGKNWTVK